MKNKRLFILTIALILVVALACIFVACGSTDNNDVNMSTNQPQQNGETQNVNAQIVISPQMLSSSQNSFILDPAITEETPYNIVVSYKDDSNYYYCLRLGRLKNVPVDKVKTVMRYEMSQVTIKRSYTKSMVTSTSIESATARIESRLDYDDHIAGWGFEEEVSVKELFSEKVALNMQYYSDTTTKTNQFSTIEREETVLTESETLEIIFDSSCATGDYRIVNVMDYDVYVYVIKNISTGDYEYLFKVLPINMIIERYEYTNGEFQDVSLSDIHFDENIVAILPIPVDVLSGEFNPVDNPEEAGISVPTYMLSFNSNGGSRCDNITATAGSNIQLPTTQKDGKIFAGWYYYDERVELTEMPNHSMVLTAKWLDKSISQVEATSSVRNGVRCKNAKYVTCSIRRNKKYFAGGWYITDENSLEKNFDPKVINAYITAGCSKVKVTIKYTAHAINDCYEEHWLYYNGTQIDHDYFGVKDGDISQRSYTRTFDLTSNVNVEIKFVGYGADKYNDWELSGFTVILEFS